MSKRNIDAAAADDDDEEDDDRNNDSYCSDSPCRHHYAQPI